MDPLFVAVGDDLAGDCLEIVSQSYDMIAVPVDAAAYVQKNLRQELEHAGDFVGDAFRRMIMAGIEREQHFAGDCIAEIKLVRADDVTFRSDAEKFWFD